jgi:hypothetical protein
MLFGLLSVRLSIQLKILLKKEKYIWDLSIQQKEYLLFQSFLWALTLLYHLLYVFVEAKIIMTVV